MTGRSSARLLLKMRKMSVAQAEKSFQSSAWRTEQLADDRDGVGLADVGHELALAVAGDPVDQVADDGAHGGAQPVGRGRGEGGRDEAAQAGVLVALHGEDRLAPPFR